MCSCPLSLELPSLASSFLLLPPLPSLFLLPSTQVPASYINLQKVIAEEVRNCQVKETPPVLSQKEFAALADRMPDSDISDPEELSLGMK